MVGVDLRFEIPRLHLIYRYFIAKGKLRVYGVGLRSLGLSKYNVRHIGITTESIVEIVEGRHRWLNVLRNFNYDKLTLLNAVGVGEIPLLVRMQRNELWCEIM